MNIISELSENIHITDKRRKEILDIFKTMVLHMETVSGIIKDLSEHKDLCDNEKSYIMYTFALSETATAIKMSKMDSATQEKFIEFLKETIISKK